MFLFFYFAIKETQREVLVFHIGMLSQESCAFTGINSITVRSHFLLKASIHF